MVELLQRALDRPQGGGCHMTVTRRGIELATLQQYLDHPDIDLLFQQVGREAMPQRVQGDPLVDVGGLLGVVKDAAQLAGGQRIGRVLSWKQPAMGQHHALLPASTPPGAQKREQIVR